MKRTSLVRTLLLVALAAPLACCAPDASVPPAKSAGAWTEDYNAALQTAKAEKKIVVLHFTGSDWCEPCQDLEKTVLSSDAFAKWSKDKVLVELDFPNKKPQTDALKKQNADLYKQYNVQGYPTVILLTSEGKEIARDLGYDGQAADAYIAAREKDIAAATQPRQTTATP